MPLPALMNDAVGSDHGSVGIFRLRADAGYELGRDALREWLRRGCKPAQHMNIASQLPRASGPLQRTLEVLT